MTDYEIAVRSLGYANTHLKLHERAKLALKQLRQDAKPLPDDFMSKVQLAIYRRQNAIAYKERNFPGWDDLPKEFRDIMVTGYPHSGSGMANLNTMLGLFRMAEEAENELKIVTVPDPQETEIERMIADYKSLKQ